MFKFYHQVVKVFFRISLFFYFVVNYAYNTTNIILTDSD